MKSFSSFSAAVPENLEAVVKRPTFIVLSWSPPPSPFNGSYLITYFNSSGEVGSGTTSLTTFNITGLPSFTLFTVEVRASNTPVVAYGPSARIDVSTLADPVVPGGGVPAVTIPQGSPKGDGTQSQVTITIPRLVFSNDPFALR